MQQRRTETTSWLEFRLPEARSVLRFVLRELLRTARAVPVGVALGMLAFAPAFNAAWAAPSGASVVHGQVEIDPRIGGLVVRNSPGAVINWQDFSISRDEIVEFLQDSVDSAVLNRVVGGNLSEIQGVLRSNGTVFLINPNGIVVGNGATIDTRGFVASTLNITDEDFRDGRLTFSGDGGAIENRGVILAEIGDVMLIAPRIENSGLIEAANGDVLLAAGRSVTIAEASLEGVSFEIQAPSDEVLNLGEILAGGTVAAFAGTLTQSGVIEAAGVAVDANGQIILAAAGDLTATAESVTRTPGGHIHIESGTAAASAPTAELNTTWVEGRVDTTSDAAGGQIDLVGPQVGVAGDARVLSDGALGGGLVHIGGSQQGRGPLRNATNTYIAPDARVSASATVDGDGGRVIAFAETTTRVLGKLEALGGSESGDGGFIETSGLLNLEIPTLPDARAPNGTDGTWLIDPDDLTVSDVAGNTNITGDGEFNVDPFAPTAATAVLDDDVLVAAFGSFAHVEVEASGDITFDATSVVDPGTGNTETLTIDAGGNILLQGSITDGTDTTLNINLEADGTTTLATGATVNIVGSFVVLDPADTEAGFFLGANIVTKANSVAFHQPVTVTAPNVLIDTTDGGTSTGGAIIRFFAGSSLNLNGNTLQLEAGTLGDITLLDVTDTANGVLDIQGADAVETQGGTTFNVDTLILNSASTGGQGIQSLFQSVNPTTLETLTVANDRAFQVRFLNSVTVNDATTLGGAGLVILGDDGNETNLFRGGLTVSTGTTRFEGVIKTDGNALSFVDLDATGSVNPVVLDTTNGGAFPGANVSVTGNLELTDQNLDLDIGTGTLSVTGTFIDTATAGLNVVTAAQVLVTGAANLNSLSVQDNSGLSLIQFGGDTTIDAVGALADDPYDLFFLEDFTHGGTGPFDNTGVLKLGDDASDVIAINASSSIENINSVTSLTGTMNLAAASSSATLLVLDTTSSDTINLNGGSLQVGLDADGAPTLNAGGGTNTPGGTFDLTGRDILLTGGGSNFKLNGSVDIQNAGAISITGSKVQLLGHELTLGSIGGTTANITGILDGDAGNTSQLTANMNVVATQSSSFDKLSLVNAPAGVSVSFEQVNISDSITTGANAVSLSILGSGSTITNDITFGAGVVNLQLGDNGTDFINFTNGLTTTGHNLTMGGTLRTQSGAVAFDDLTLVANSTFDTTHLSTGAAVSQGAGKTVALDTFRLEFTAGVGAISLNNVTHTSGGDLQFNSGASLAAGGTITADTVSFAAGYTSSADFTNVVQAASLTTGASGMSLDLSGNGTTIGSTTFAHTGGLSIGSTPGTTITLNGGVTYNTGTLNLSAALATDGAITTGPILLAGDGVLNNSASSSASINVGAVDTGAGGHDLGIVPAATGAIDIASMSNNGSLTVASGSGSLGIAGVATLNQITTPNTSMSVNLTGIGSVIGTANFLNTGGLQVIADGGVYTFTNGLNYNVGTLNTRGTIASSGDINLSDLNLSGDLTLDLDDGGGAAGDFTGASVNMTSGVTLTIESEAASSHLFSGLFQNGSVTLVNDGSLTFNGNSTTVNTITTPATMTGTVAFNGSSTAITSASMAHTGGLFIGDGAGDVITFGSGLSYSAAATHINGTLAGSNALVLPSVDLNGVSVIDTSGAGIGTGAIDIGTIVADNFDFDLRAEASSNIDVDLITNGGAVSVQAGQTFDLDGASSLSSLFVDGVFGGAVSLLGNGTSIGSATFNHSGGLVIGNQGPADLIAINGDTIYTAGTTTLNGNLDAEGLVLLGAVTLAGASEIDTDDGNGSLGAITTGAITGAGFTLTLVGETGSVAQISSVNGNGTVDLGKGSLQIDNAATLSNLLAAGAGSVSLLGDTTVIGTVALTQTGGLTIGDSAGDTVQITSGLNYTAGATSLTGALVANGGVTIAGLNGTTADITTTGAGAGAGGITTGAVTGDLALSAETASLAQLASFSGGGALNLNNGSLSVLGTSTIGNLTSAATAQDVSIAGNGTTVASSTFQHVGILKIGAGSETVTLNGGVTFNAAGVTELNGTLASDGPIVLDDVTLLGNSILNTSTASPTSGAITTDIVNTGGFTLIVDAEPGSLVNLGDVNGNGGLNVANAGVATVNGAATLSTLTTSANGLQLRLIGGGTVTNATLAHSGGQQFGDDGGDLLEFTNGATLANSTLLAGTFRTTNAAINANDIELVSSSATLQSGTGAITVGSVDLKGGFLTVDGNSFVANSIVDTGGGIPGDLTAVLTNGLTITGSTTADFVDLDIGDNNGLVAFNGAVNINSIQTRANSGEASTNFGVEFGAGGTITGALDTNTFFPGDGLRVVGGATLNVASVSLAGLPFTLNGAIHTTAGSFQTSVLNLTGNSSIDTTTVVANGFDVRGTAWNVGSSELLVNAGTDGVVGGVDPGLSNIFLSVDGTGGAFRVTRADFINLLDEGSAGSLSGLTTLELNADLDVTFNAGAGSIDINGAGAAVHTINAGRDVFFNADVLDSVAGGDTLNLVVNAARILNVGGSVAANDLQLEGLSNGIVFASTANLNVTNLTLNADPASLVNASDPLVGITASTLTLKGGSFVLGANANLANPAASLINVGSVTVDPGRLTGLQLVNAGPLTVTALGAPNTPNINYTFSAAGNLSVPGFDIQGFGASAVTFNSTTDITLTGNIFDSIGGDSEGVGLFFGSGGTVNLNGNVLSNGEIAQLSLMATGAITQGNGFNAQADLLIVQTPGVATLGGAGNDFDRIGVDVQSIALTDVDGVIIGDSSDTTVNFVTRTGGNVTSGGTITFDHYDYDTGAPTARTEQFSAINFQFLTDITDLDTGTGSEDALSLILNAETSALNLDHIIDVFALELALGGLSLVQDQGELRVDDLLSLRGGAIGTFLLGSPTDTDAVTAGRLTAELSSQFDYYQTGNLILDDIQNTADSDIHVSGAISIAADGLNFNTVTGGVRQLAITSNQTGSALNINNAIFDSDASTVDDVFLILGTDQAPIDINSSITVPRLGLLGLTPSTVSVTAAVGSALAAGALFASGRLDVDLSSGTHDFDTLSTQSLEGLSLVDQDDLTLAVGAGGFQPLDIVSGEIVAAGDIVLDGFDSNNAGSPALAGQIEVGLTSTLGNITVNGPINDSDSGTSELIRLELSATAGTVTIAGVVDGTNNGGPIDHLIIEGNVINDGPAGAATGVLGDIPTLGFVGNSLSFENTHGFRTVGLSVANANFGVSGDLQFAAAPSLLLLESAVGPFAPGQSLDVSAGGILTVPGFDVDGLGAAAFRFASGSQIDVNTDITDAGPAPLDLTLDLVAPTINVAASISVQNLTLDGANVNLNGSLFTDNLTIAEGTPLSLAGSNGLSISANNNLTLGQIDVNGATVNNPLIQLTSNQGDVSLGGVFDSDGGATQELANLELTAGNQVNLTGNLEGLNDGGPVVSLFVNAPILDDGGVGQLLGVDTLAFTGSTINLTSGQHDVRLMALQAQDVSFVGAGDVTFADVTRVSNNSVVGAFGVTNSANIVTTGELTVPSLGVESLGAGAYDFASGSTLTVASPIQDSNGLLRLGGQQVNLEASVSVASLIIDADGLSQTAPITAADFALRGNPVNGPLLLNDAANDFDRVAVQLGGTGGVDLIDQDDIKFTELTLNGETFAGFRVSGSALIDASGQLEIDGIDYNGIGAGDYFFSTDAGDLLLTNAPISDADPTTVDTLRVGFINGAAGGAVRVNTRIEADVVELGGSLVSDEQFGFVLANELNVAGAQIAIDNVDANGAGLSNVNFLRMPVPGGANAGTGGTNGNAPGAGQGLLQTPAALTYVDQNDFTLGDLIAGSSATLTGTSITVEQLSSANVLTLSAGAVTANGSLNVTSADVSNVSGSVAFNGAVNLGALTVGGSAASVAFNAGGVINSATNFDSTGALSFGNDASDVLNFAGGFTVAGTRPLQVAGRVESGGSNILIPNLAVLSNATLNSGGGSIGIQNVSGSGLPRLDLQANNSAVNLGAVSGLGVLATAADQLLINGQFSAGTLDLASTSLATLNGNGTVGELIQQGGLAGGGTVTVTNRFSWLGGAQGGAGVTRVGPNAVLAGTLAGAPPGPAAITAPRILDNRRILEHQGTSVIPVPVTLTVNNGARFVNQGTLDLQGNVSFVTSAGNGFLDNTGTLRRSANNSADGAAALTQLQLQFNNSGLVEVIGSELLIDRGGLSSGEFRLTQGARLRFEAAPGATVGNVLTDGARFTGNASQVDVTGRGIDVVSTTNPVFVGQDIEMFWRDAAISGTGTLNIDGRLLVTGTNSFTGTLATDLGTPPAAGAVADLPGGIPGDLITAQLPTPGQPVVQPQDRPGTVALIGFDSQAGLQQTTLALGGLLNNGQIVSIGDLNNSTGVPVPVAGAFNQLTVLGQGEIQNNGSIGTDAAGLRVTGAPGSTPTLRNRGRLAAVRNTLDLSGVVVANEGLLGAAAGAQLLAGQVASSGGFVRGAGVINATAFGVGAGTTVLGASLNTQTLAVGANGLLNQIAGPVLNTQTIQSAGEINVLGTVNAGSLEQTAGVLRLGTGSSLQVQNAALLNGRFEALNASASAGQFGLLGTAELRGSTQLAGPVQVGANGTLAIISGGPVIGVANVATGRLTNDGLVVLDNASPTAQGTNLTLASLDNRGRIEARGTGGVGTRTVRALGPLGLANTGVIAATGAQLGLVTDSAEANFVQNGTLAAQAADINVAAGVLNTGTIAAAAGRQFTATSLVANGGALLGAGSISAQNLRIAGATQLGVASLNAQNGLIDSGAVVTREGNINFGSLAISQGASLTASTLNVRNALTVSEGSSLTATSLGVQNSVAVTQAASLSTSALNVQNSLSVDSATLSASGPAQVGALSTNAATVTFAELTAGAVTVGTGSTATFNGPTTVSGAASIGGLANLFGTFSAESFAVTSGGRSMLNDAQLTAPVTVDQVGFLGGNGAIVGNVTNSGTVSPGFSPGILSITGDFTQTATGLLDIEVGGSGTFVAGQDFDALNISGTATLGGTLRLTQSGATTLEDLATAGVSPITWGAVEGDFATVESAEGNETLFAGTLTATGLQVALPECQKQNMQQQEEQQQVEEAQEESQDQVAQSVGCN